MEQTIAVLGAGTMGHGIAQLLAQSGSRVYLYDPSEEALERAMQKIRSNVAVIRSERWGDCPSEDRVLGRIVCTPDPVAAVAGASIVIEAAPEKLELKRELYRLIERGIRADAIVASNTSSYVPEQLVEGMTFAHRFVVAHFFNPAHLVPLVEIVLHPQTNRQTAEPLIRLLEACGKSPVVLSANVAGFIANRLQAALLREAVHLLESGVASAREIDLAVTEGPGLRWALSGPLATADYGGLDVWERVSDRLFPELDTRTEAPESIRRLVRGQRLGVKSGGGFFEYPDGDANGADHGLPDGVQDAVEQRDRKLIRLMMVKNDTWTGGDAQ
ncbi:3-hydroxyacyl-CoA dehydrogenase family protein [Paenibacillus sp. GYB004]|uniref:3-hydroxyacyl-CoA dehydrogenase family protein n=1 Tax=Paenibacillus sp. GYB004 TaxID=2994393 RepID=UPI002F9642AB